MTDNRSPQSRSALMARIGGKDTAPELLVRRLLHSFGYRFRLHKRELPGTPDLVFPSRKKIIFVNGCYWHAHGCRIGKLPKSHLDFWGPKLERNRDRDRINKAALRAMGWAVLTVWQCQTRKPDRLSTKLLSFLGPAGKNRTRNPKVKR
ncbi:MAG TPA: very short patch repair endonuclease [Terracidiphilus sp.]|nr:very short patch repair endonuclease [Terracidiphilus sp.]